MWFLGITLDNLSHDGIRVVSRAVQFLNSLLIPCRQTWIPLVNWQTHSNPLKLFTNALPFSFFFSLEISVDILFCLVGYSNKNYWPIQLGHHYYMYFQIILLFSVITCVRYKHFLFWGINKGDWHSEKPILRLTSHLGESICCKITLYSRFSHQLIIVLY